MSYLISAGTSGIVFLDQKLAVSDPNPKKKIRSVHISRKNLEQSYNVHLNFVNYFLGPVLGQYPNPKLVGQ
jgi:hypothetical protein